MGNTAVRQGKSIVESLPERVVEKRNLGMFIRIFIGSPVVVDAAKIRQNIAGVKRAASFELLPVKDLECPPARKVFGSPMIPIRLLSLRTVNFRQGSVDFQALRLDRFTLKSC